MKLRFLLLLVSLSVLCISFAGCGPSGPSVSGTVTLDGQPLSDAELQFASFDPAQRLGAETVRSDAQGKFTIEPQARKTPLRPGKYGVRVYKWVDKKTGQVPSAEDLEQLKLAGKLKNLVPAKYGDLESNPVTTVEIHSGTNNDVKIELRGR